MLQLKGIIKNYTAGDTEVHALKGIDIRFRESEFVSILGPSGCGKTTMLNIIGGLDRYTDGDLIIGGRSTREFKDKDWDSYRNHKIGFVFQNYNLIPHQTVLANVELALTLSGVSKSERRRRAAEALAKVGLKDQLHKKPNQMSGGQMQRVAIARALVNDPDIILADEPTGALDSETSIAIMNILREISGEKLIIMVTHNAELAEQYSSRIIRLLDGKVIDDSAPYEGDDLTWAKPSQAPAHSRKSRSKSKVSMSFGTALSLSFKNLLTKKGRTFLTSFAGSIGIIGIALILSLSNGFQAYINKVQEDTISTYPITIEDENMDMTSLMETMLGKSTDDVKHEDGRIYTSPILGDMINTMMAEVKTNSLGELKAYFESDECNIKDYTTDIQYGYDTNLNIYLADTSDGLNKVNPSTMMEDIMGVSQESAGTSSMMSPYSNSNLWTQMIDNKDLLDSQYNVIAGRWPENYNEVVLVVSKDSTITDVTQYALGLKNSSELKNIMTNLGSGKQIDSRQTSYTYDDLLGLTYKLVLSSDYYRYDETNKRWEDKSSDDEYVKTLVDNGTEIKIVGIIQPDEDAVATSITGSIGYTKALTEYVINETSKSDIVKAQLADDKTDVFTGLPFAVSEDELDNITVDDVKAYIATLPEAEQQAAQMYLGMMTDEQLVDVFKNQLQTKSGSSYKDNMIKLGYADESKPASINIYARDFESKDAIADIIDEYNDKATAAGDDNLTISYTDYVGLMMSSVSTIVNTISYVLIAFVSISLVVSSIMIGIITYISVLERTKEIGILRSIGASKRDVSNVFNAETMIVGLVSGSLGILITLLLDIPINIVIKHLTGISGVASLPWQGAVILIAISVLLTLVAGLIPAKVASRKDPVIALRSE